MNKVFGGLILGLAIGVAATWGYLHTQRLQPALERAVQADAARDKAATAAKTLEGQLKEAKQSAEKLQSAGKAAEQSLKAAKDQLAAAVSAKESAEKAASELKGQLAAAVSAKEAAEKALAEAKKTPPAQPAPAAQ